MTRQDAGAPRLICRDCRAEFPLGPYFAGCPHCARSDRAAALEVVYDYDHYRNRGTLDSWQGRGGVWSFRELLPLPPGTAPCTLAEGNTPLLPIRTPGPGRIWLKDETRNPTGAHKDRFHSVSVSMARSLGLRKATAATTGNHGTSLAAYAAKAGMHCLVFCDVRSPAVLRQAMQVYGARVATLQKRGQHLEWLVRERGWYPSTAMTPMPTATPYGVEGYKTIAYELFQQLGGRMPGRVVVPVAVGDILYGPWKGFRELRALGAGGELPRMHAVQAAGCAPIVEGFRTGAKEVPVHPDPRTIAVSIGDETAAAVTLETIRDSGGTAEAVSDDDIVDAMRALAREGIIAEPAGASSLAAALQMQRSGAFTPNEDVVCIVTGAGVKWPTELALAADPHELRDEDASTVRAWIDAFDREIA
jgi:threonine synthase